MKLICFLALNLLAQNAIRVEQARFRPFQISVTGDKQLASQVLSALELSGVFKESTPATAEGHVLIKVGKGKVSVVANKKMLSYNEGSFRALSHQIANDIYEHFTGQKGMFNSQIAASKMTPQGKQIVLMDFDGHDEREVTKSSNINILPTISPSGNEIFFTSYIHKNPDLFSIGTNGSDLKTISNYKGLNSGASFSPNGKTIALTLSTSGKGDIYLLDLATKEKTLLSPGNGLNTSPSFSPDGSQIAFVSNRSGNPHVYMMNKDGSNPKRITFQGKYNQAPKWSPLGDLIVFTARDERNVFDIFLVDVKSGKISRVTQDQGNNEEASFAPNGQMLVFTSTRNGHRELYVSNLDGSFQKKISSAGDYWTPYWGPSR